MARRSGPGLQVGARGGAALRLQGRCRGDVYGWAFGREVMADLFRTPQARPEEASGLIVGLAAAAAFPPAFFAALAALSFALGAMEPAPPRDPASVRTSVRIPPRAPVRIVGPGLTPETAAGTAAAATGDVAGLPTGGYAFDADPGPPSTSAGGLLDVRPRLKPDVVAEPTPDPVRLSAPDDLPAVR